MEEASKAADESERLVYSFVCYSRLFACVLLHVGRILPPCSFRRALQSRQVTDDTRIEELQQRIQKTAKEAAEAERKYQEVLNLV